ncbi:hypothetical protein K439DRAFT_1615138 [Ramaria rubella]|nr:hypothetical protein K439DRAFT_1615138 [Ramaria rubella]
MSATSRSMNTVNAGAPGPLTGLATSRNVYSSPQTPVSSLENNNIVALHAKITFDKDTYVQLFDNIDQHIGVVERQVGDVEHQVSDLDQRLIDLEATTETNHQDLTDRLERSNEALLHRMDTDKQQLFELLGTLASRLDTIVARFTSIQTVQTGLGGQGPSQRSRPQAPKNPGDLYIQIQKQWTIPLNWIQK